MKNSADRIIRELVDTALHPGISVRRSMEETGKQAIGCFPIYTPDELVYAAGMLPVGMWGGQTTINKANRYLQSFCCSLMRINTEQAIEGVYDQLSGVVLTAFCDTLKCTMENWKAAFPQMKLMPIVYPQNRKLPEGKTYLMEEFRRLLNELEQISGISATQEALEHSVALYEEYRQSMNSLMAEISRRPSMFDARTRHMIMKASYFMDKRRYTDKILELLETIKSLEPTDKKKWKRVVLTGLISEPAGILDIMTQNGIAVVADDLAHGSRQFRATAAGTGDALERMAGRIANQDGCAFLYDGSKSRGKRLIELVDEARADGVIVFQMKFCDPEEFDYPLYKADLDRADIPVLYLEIEQKMDSLEQYRTRIQSFAEMLEIRQLGRKDV